MAINQYVNQREASLKNRLLFLAKQLKRAQEPSLALIVPSYQYDIQDEIKFVKLQLDRIKTARKSQIKIVK